MSEMGNLLSQKVSQIMTAVELTRQDVDPKTKSVYAALIRSAADRLEHESE